jgi:hypothetical protein
MVPTLGSMVQNGKFAAWAFAFDKQLNKVDFPTFGRPTIPHFNAMIFELGCKDRKKQGLPSFKRVSPYPNLTFQLRL